MLHSRCIFRGNQIFCRFYTTFDKKGQAEENRYYLQKQKEQIKQLRKKLECLEEGQHNLQDQLDKATEALEKMRNNDDAKNQTNKKE